MARSDDTGRATAKLRILVCLHSWYYFKNLSAVFERLDRDGHRLSIVALNHDREDFLQAVTRFQEAHPDVHVGMTPARSDGWSLMCWNLRQTLGYLHFLEPRFDATPRLRGRVHKRTAWQIQTLLDRPKYRHGLRRRLLSWLVRRMERAVPADPGIAAVLQDFRPDVVMLSPLIDLDAAQWDYLKAAKALGIPTVFAVYSWDNLSSKTLLYDRPERVLVWNERQVQEARDYHDVPRRLIGVTGAQCFDEWFQRTPSLDRPAFFRQLGLDPERPTILYVCSATTRRDLPETDFTLRWLAALRDGGGDGPADANVIIRPHPKRELIWSDVDLTPFGPVCVHPQQGQLPIADQARAVFFDSLYHCDAVVGLNTSALIEAGIVGRPVLTVLDPAFAVDQTETFHFPYLLDASEGFLIVAKDLAEHRRQLAAALARPEESLQRSRAFVRAFIRPRGTDVPAVDAFVNEVVAVAAGGRRRPQGGSLLDRLLRLRMRPFVYDPERFRFQSGKLKKRVLARDRRREADAPENEIDEEDEESALAAT